MIMLQQQLLWRMTWMLFPTGLTNGQFNLILKKQKVLYLVEGTGSTHLYILD